MTPFHQQKSAGFILAGMQSSSGKTAITCMILSALQRRGLAIQPFKVGPDFIDPSYHTHYANRPCINLDTWLMGQEQVVQNVKQYGAGRLGVIEGVMGLFDGASPTSDEGSTMELARLLDWPIILIVPCQKVGRSVGAAIRGFIEQAGNHRIAGLILNQVGGIGHGSYLKEALADLKIPILGVISFDDSLKWPERHLGLQAQSEMQLPTTDTLATLAESVLDFDTILSWLAPRKEEINGERFASQRFQQKRIGIARDEAFHFYYHANLEFFRQAGATLIEFSPLHDQALPTNLDGIVFGGGFPEVFAEQLADNQSMRQSIAQAIHDDLPCYAECGGLMLLAEELRTLTGEVFPMAGVIPEAVQMTSRLQNFGYCFSTPLLSSSQSSWRGHEFHYSQWLGELSHANLWKVAKKTRKTSRTEGYEQNRLHASYVHLYFPTASSVLENLFV